MSKPRNVQAECQIKLMPNITGLHKDHPIHKTLILVMGNPLRGNDGVDCGVLSITEKPNLFSPEGVPDGVMHQDQVWSSSYCEPLKSKVASIYQAILNEMDYEIFKEILCYSDKHLKLAGYQMLFIDNLPCCRYSFIRKEM